MSGWRRAIAAVVAALWIATTIDVIRRWQQLAIGDFETYWTGARRLLDGLPLYPPSQLDQPFVLGDAAFGRGFVYPPTAALIATPLAALPMAQAFVVFTALSALALAGVTYAISRRSGASRTRAAVIAAVVIGSGPGLDALLTGNVNALAAAALGAMWLRPAGSGYLAVTGGLVKVYPIVGLAWSVRSRASVVRPAIVGVVVVGMTLLIGGVGPWNDFRTTMANGLSTEYFPIQSPRSLLWAPLGVIGAGLVAAALTAVVVIGVVRIRDDRAAFALLGLAMILPAPEWHLHYFVVPAVAALPALSELIQRDHVAREHVTDSPARVHATAG